MSKIRLLTGLASVAILVPQFAFAATPQQMLDRAVRLSVEEPKPQAIMLDMMIKGSYQPSRTLSRRLIEESGAKTVASSFQVQLVFEGESFPRAGTVRQDGQGRIRLVKLVSTDDPAMNFSNLATLEWKTIGNVFYLRIAEVSSVVREQLSSLGANVSQLDKAIGTWLKFDPDALASFVKDSLPLDSSSTIVSQTRVSDWERLGRMLPILQVVRMEKKVTQGGQTYTRLAVRLHPGFWTRLEQQLIKSLDESLVDLKKTAPREYAKQRAQRIREIRTSLQTTRLELNKVRMVVMINDRTGRIERIEGALQKKTPSHAYVYRGMKTVKVVQGQRTINFQFVGTMRDAENKVIEEPTPFVTLQDLIQKLMDMRTESLSEPTDETDTVPTP